MDTAVQYVSLSEDRLAIQLLKEKQLNIIKALEQCGCASIDTSLGLAEKSMSHFLDLQTNCIRSNDGSVTCKGCGNIDGYSTFTHQNGQVVKGDITGKTTLEQLPKSRTDSVCLTASSSSIPLACLRVGCMPTWEGGHSEHRRDVVKACELYKQCAKDNRDAARGATRVPSKKKNL